MYDRIRFALIALTVAAAVTARVSSALAAAPRSPLPPVPEPSRAAASAHIPGSTGVIRFARHYLGVRYSYGGDSPRTGFDCSGFVRFVYAHFGVELPHYSVAQFERGRRVARGHLRAGDLVFFNALGHVGLYVGAGRFIHAPHSGTSVSIEPLTAHAAYVGARRLLGS